MQKKACRKKQHTGIDNIWDRTNLICGKSAVSGNYNLPRDNLGQLNFYLTVLDEQERKEGENPSIGILLCKQAKKSVVELAIRDYTKPMGVATYRTADELPEKLKVLAPIIEEVPKLLDNAPTDQAKDEEANH